MSTTALHCTVKSLKSKHDWVSDWVSEWQGHLLSCPGQLKKRGLLSLKIFAKSEPKILQIYHKLERLQKYKVQKRNPHQNRQKFDKTKSAENVEYPIIKTTPATLKYEHGVCKKVFPCKRGAVQQSTIKVQKELLQNWRQHREKLKNASKIIFLFRWWMTFMENRSPLMAFVPLFAW